MRLPLKVGLPLLALLLLGVGASEGRERLLLIVAAMGVALWSAFSLPHPGPQEEPPSLVEHGLREDDADDDAPDGDEPPDGPANGSGPGRPGA